MAFLTPTANVVSASAMIRTRADGNSVVLKPHTKAWKNVK